MSVLVKLGFVSVLFARSSWLEFLAENKRLDHPW
jgi:hypothetical protein